jgi:hypothetical protein
MTIQQGSEATYPANTKQYIRPNISQTTRAIIPPIPTDITIATAPKGTNINPTVEATEHTTTGNTTTNISTEEIQYLRNIITKLTANTQHNTQW